MLDLICHNRPGHACKPRQHSRVIAGSSPYVENVLPLIHMERRKINCVKNRLPVVNSAFRSKGDDDILVQKRRIVGGSFYVMAPGKYFPRTCTDKALSRR